MKCYENKKNPGTGPPKSVVFAAVPDFRTFWRAEDKTNRRTVIKVRRIDTNSIKNDVFNCLTKSLPSDFSHRPKCYENVMKIFIT